MATAIDSSQLAPTHEFAPGPTALVRRDAMTEIRELAAGLAELRAVCEALCKATILPPLMQHPANLQLVIMQGLSMGFTVWQAIRASFIIPPKKDGEVPRVGYYVDSLIALVRRSDKCRFFRIEETTAHRHRVICARTDEGTDENPIIHMFELTRQEAHEAGMDVARWKDREGRWQTGIKHNWETGPADMLNARNSGRAVKRVFQDVVFGMATPDELDELTAAEQLEANAPREYAAVPVVVHQPATATASARIERDIVDADIVSNDEAPPAAGESSGDRGWDAMLADVARITKVSTEGWLPDDLLELWEMKLAGATSKGTLNLQGPLLASVGSHVAQSKTVSDVYSKMRGAYNDRDRDLKQAERAAKAANPAGGAA